MPAPRRIAIAAAVIAVALAPGAAFAQNGAGDEQYQDPFSGKSQPAPKPKPKVVAPVPHQQLPAQQQPQPQASTSELPRTGRNLVWPAVAGVVLIAAGLALLRRAGHARD